MVAGNASHQGLSASPPGGPPSRAWRPARALAAGGDAGERRDGRRHGLFRIRCRSSCRPREPHRIIRIRIFGLILARTTARLEWPRADPESQRERSSAGGGALASALLALAGHGLTTLSDDVALHPGRTRRRAVRRGVLSRTLRRPTSSEPVCFRHRRPRPPLHLIPSSVYLPLPTTAASPLGRRC